MNREIIEMAIVGYETRAKEALMAIESLHRSMETDLAPVHVYPRKRGRPPLASKRLIDALPVDGPRKPANYQQPKRARKPLSAKARKAISKAQKARWTAHRAAQKVAKK